MKKVVLFGILLALSASPAKAETTYKPVEIQPENIFVPADFSETEEAQLVTQGNFPSQCYRGGFAQAEVDVQSGTIVVTDFAEVSNGHFCALSLVPYMHTVSLGRLPAGTYHVLSGTSRATMTTLVIHEATEANP